MSATLVLTKTINVQEKSAVAEKEEIPAREALLFEFSNCCKGLGIKICGGCSNDGEELYGVFIKRILPGGLADQQGSVLRGDQILEVNGESLEGVTNERAVSILRQACASNYVEIVVCRDDIALKEFSEVLERNNALTFPATPVPSDTQQQKESTRKTAVYSQLTPVQQQDPGTEPAGTTQQEQSVTVQTKLGPMQNGGATSQLPWRDLHPSMASTPLNKGSVNSAKLTGSDLQSYSILCEDLSPLRSPSMSDLMSYWSVFDTNNTEPIHEQRNISLTRKLSIDPCVQLKVEKLNAALQYLNLHPTIEKEILMRSKLKIDSSGTVRYGDFVNVVKDVFKQELEERNIGGNDVILAACDITDLVEPPAFRSECHTMGGTSKFNQKQIELENKQLHEENVRLQVLLSEKEDEILRIRKEAQGAIHEQRELRSKVHLAAKAQKAARDMEHDYEEVVHLLEGEIAQLKLQLSRQSGCDPIMQRRLAVLTCQLKKAESEKDTFKVSTEKLLQFAESVYETCSENAAASRLLTLPKTSGYLGKHKQTPTTTNNLAAEAKDVVKTVRSLIDTQSLPFGWEETYTTDGIKYYINHLNQVTTWNHPLSNVNHLPTVLEDKKSKGNEPATS